MSFYYVANTWNLVIYKFFTPNKMVNFFFFFRLTKLLTVKQWCYKMPFWAFLIHHLSAYLEMYQYILLNKYPVRLVLNYESSEFLNVLLIWSSLYLLINKEYHNFRLNVLRPFHFISYFSWSFIKLYAVLSANISTLKSTFKNF